MDMATAARRWTVEMVRSLPDDGNRYEVVDGILLVSPAPSWPHQNAVGELHVLLSSYLRDHPIGHAMGVDHSYLKATIGSIRAARRAGT